MGIIILTSLSFVGTPPGGFRSFLVEKPLLFALTAQALTTAGPNAETDDLAKSSPNTPEPGCFQLDHVGGHADLFLQSLDHFQHAEDQGLTSLVATRSRLSSERISIQRVVSQREHS